MSEWKTYKVYVEDGFYHYISAMEPPEIGSFDQDYDEIIGVEEVEVRPVHQEPCEWESDQRNAHMIEFLNDHGSEYCPMCGRF